MREPEDLMGAHAASGGGGGWTQAGDAADTGHAAQPKSQTRKAECGCGKWAPAVYWGTEFPFCKMKRAQEREGVTAQQGQWTSCHEPYGENG